MQVEPWTTAPCCLPKSSGDPSHANPNAACEAPRPLQLPLVCHGAFIPVNGASIERVQNLCNACRNCPVRIEGRCSLLTTPSQPRPLVSLASSVNLLNSVHERCPSRPATLGCEALQTQLRSRNVEDAVGDVVRFAGAVFVRRGVPLTWTRCVSCCLKSTRRGRKKWMADVSLRASSAMISSTTTSDSEN